MTKYWNETCSIKDFTYAIERNAAGAITNSVIAKGILEKELESVYSVYRLPELSGNLL